MAASAAPSRWCKLNKISSARLLTITDEDGGGLWYIKNPIPAPVTSNTSLADEESELNEPPTRIVMIISRRNESSYHRVPSLLSWLWFK